MRVLAAEKSPAASVVQVSGGHYVVEGDEGRIAYVWVCVLEDCKKFAVYFWHSKG